MDAYIAHVTGSSFAMRFRGSLVISPPSHLIGRNTVDTEEFEGAAGNFKLSAVRDKLGRSSPETYVVFECVDKLLGELHRINVDDISVHANKDLATSGTVVNGWCISV